MSTRFISIVVAHLILCLNTAFAQSPQGAITTPIPGSTLSGSTVTFTWSAGTGASGYWLDVGTAEYGNTIYQSGTLSNTVFSQTVSGLPTNGSPVYATLYTISNGTKVYNEYMYTAFNAAAAAAVMTSPASPSTLPGSSVTFTWSAGTGASGYWLDVGTAEYGNTIYQSGTLSNTVFSQTVSGLPTNGSPVYATLYTISNGTKVYNEYTYTAFNAAATAAVMTSPTGSTLSGSSVTFQWSTASGASGYWLDVGTVQYGNTIYQSGTLSNTVLSLPVSGLPTNGSPVYATLYTIFGNGTKVYNEYTYGPSQAQILGAIENVNNYWIANNSPGNSDWTQATYFTGDLAAYDATGQANYLSFAQSWATENSYSLTGGNTTTYPNYQAAGQVYIRLYQLSNKSSDLSGITESINGMVNSTVDNEWTWIDAINMSMPDFAELGSIDNNTNYYTKMYALYSYTKYSLGLYDSTIGLWWENSTYANTSTYWSRGNGWVFAAHAKVLSVLPESDPHYAEYLSTFTTMAQALAACQQPGGYWNSDLGGADYAGPESSGTSFFLYGLAWGLNKGILDQNTYLPVVENAWNFLANTAIQPSGLLGYVQPSGSGPGPTSATTTEDFGVGAFLLAGRQMALLTQ
jgi:rhamnogalacturonyl hydrolase YesR